MPYEPPLLRSQASIEELFQEGVDIINSGFLRLHAKERELEAIIHALDWKITQQDATLNANVDAETREAIRKAGIPLP